MTTLSEHNLQSFKSGVASPGYNRGALGIGIVHIGPGAFHRAHQAIFTEDAVQASGGNWGICAVSLNSREVCENLSSQDGLYTLAIRDRDPGYRVVGIIKEALCARDHAAKVMERLCSANSKIVTLTITEKGYGLNSDGRLDLASKNIAQDLQNPEQPVSAIGYLVQACRLRQQAGTPPLTIISCDNLSSNGDKLKAACLDYAAAVDADLASYIAEQVRFPNTMVDSITPAANETLGSEVNSELGVTDLAPVQREAFRQWVIEDNLPDDRPDWAAAGVIITSNVDAFEKAKLCILNAAHSSLAYLGLLLGRETVEQAIHTPELRQFVDQLVLSESIPSMNCPEDFDLVDYWSQIKARFENPQIRHFLEQISQDGSQKIPVRLFPLIRHAMLDDRLASHACFVVSAWLRASQVRRIEDQALVDGYLQQLPGGLPDIELNPKDYAQVMLDNPAIFPCDISKAPQVRNAILGYIEQLAQMPVLDAIKQLNK